MKIELPRNWYLVIVGLEDWRGKASTLPYSEYLELKSIIDNFLSRVNKEIRGKGGLVFSLFWSQEPLAPAFLLEATKLNEKFLKELRARMSDITERILASLTSEERSSTLGKNIQKIGLRSRILLLELKIPINTTYTPSDENVIEAFSDALNSELICIKRSEHDFLGRKHWLSLLDGVLSREYMREVGPIKKLKEAKEVEGKRQFDRKTPGDFEKITRIFSEAIAYRPSLFELKAQNTTFDTREPLGQIMIQYLVCDATLPYKLNWRSNTHERLGRKVEEMQLLNKELVQWQDIDKLLSISESIVYDKFEKVISDVGGIKFDSLWTERDLSLNTFFLPKFSFTEDILKGLKEFFFLDSRQQLINYIGPSTAELFDVWRRAGLHYNLLVFDVIGIDQEEDNNLINWIKQLKGKVIPGPNYTAEKEVIEERYYRPL